MQELYSSGFNRLIDIGGKALLFQVIEIFLNHVPPKITKCQQHLQKNEFKALQLLAHNIKSSAANLGLNELHSLAAQLEISAEQKAEHECQKIFAEVLVIFPSILGILKEKYKSLEEECQ